MKKPNLFLHWQMENSVEFIPQCIEVVVFVVVVHFPFPDQMMEFKWYFRNLNWKSPSFLFRLETQLTHFQTFCLTFSTEFNGFSFSIVDLWNFYCIHMARGSFCAVWHQRDIVRAKNDRELQEQKFFEIKNGQIFLNV